MTNSTSGSAVTSDSPWARCPDLKHLAIIPDGNRRWARDRGLDTLEGHRKGLLEVLPDLIDYLSEQGVHTISVWGFSTENWNRSAQEIEYLMRIFTDFVRDVLAPMAHRHKARVVHLGRKDRLPRLLFKVLADLEQATANFEVHGYNVALDYGGRDELARAFAKAAAEAGMGFGNLASFLDTAGQLHPFPDAVVRSSGEYRLSGFLPYQAAYAELFFVGDLFPDFTRGTLDAVAAEFSSRRRRFGR